MTAPMSPSPARVGDDRAGGATTFDEDMRAALAAGEPLLDNVVDVDRIGPYGLEPDYETCDECGDRVHTVSTRGLCDGCEEEAEQEARDAVTCRRCDLVVDQPTDLSSDRLCKRCDFITDHVGFVPRRKGWL